ncbi:uncharacterized protein [Blastocystis hominis]|uniref:Uncharacterized protein n=1 Tax=Blastocystis hominis TaxID=12968 RepID=D8M4T5_BLAHO|nr:uncharacterized protein [Blastocystis hominis]CBK23074.2 unnamed protein product [Blastocystis hominis]|eukprot:XP_012897122.1 uncharacterized protein [Blastocystis hominis]
MSVQLRDLKTTRKETISHSIRLDCVAKDASEEEISSVIEAKHGECADYSECKYRRVYRHCLCEIEECERYGNSSKENACVEKTRTGIKHIVGHFAVPKLSVESTFALFESSNMFVLFMRVLLADSNAVYSKSLLPRHGFESLWK